MRVPPAFRLLGAALAFALAAGGCGSPQEFAQEPTWPKPKRGAVVSEHPLATRVGLEVLEAGGNAADAAVATALALAVVYPQAGNLGGGGFALWVPHKGKADAIDFRERAPAAADTAQYLVDGKPLAIDFLPVADHARDGAETAGDPHRARVGERGQAAVEHARIELVGLAVDVDIAAREMRPHQRIAALNDAESKLVHKTVLGAAKGRQVEPRA